MGPKRKRTGKRARRPRPEARLVQFEEKKRIATRVLRGNETRIGRDPTSDLIIDYANVSRHHAAVRELGDRNVVLDLGSTNGLRVNGIPIGGKPRLLEQGDLIQLSDQVVLLYEEGPFASSTPWVVTAIAMLVLLAASVGLYLSQRPSDTSGGAPSTQSGPERNEPGTDSRVPQSDMPQLSGFKGDSQIFAGRWYAVAPGRSSGDTALDPRQSRS